jgi:hypothetical protein
MNKNIYIIFLLLILFTLFSCSSDQTISSIKSLEKYLANSVEETTVLSPIALKVKIDLGDMTLMESGWYNLLYTLDQAGKYVALDLSLCKMSTPVFDPNKSVKLGKSYIVALTLPDMATGIVERRENDYSGATFEHFRNLRSFDWKNGTSISDYAFDFCTQLERVTIPTGVTFIGKSAFDNCSALNNITMPEGVTSIGDYAFRDWSALTEITIPESVTSIGYLAFYKCQALESVTIGKAVNKIGANAFTDCDNLTRVTFNGTIPLENMPAENWNNPFPGDLREKYIANGTGTYTRESGDREWKLEVRG